MFRSPMLYFELFTVTLVIRRFVKDGEIQNTTKVGMRVRLRVCVCVCLSRTAVEGKNAINKKKKGEKRNKSTYNIMFIDAFVILDLMCRSPIIDFLRGGKSV